jgi:hypothetical protein
MFPGFEDKTDFLAPMPMKFQAPEAKNLFEMPEPVKPSPPQVANVAPKPLQQVTNKFAEGFGTGPREVISHHEVEVRTKVLTLPVPKDYAVARLD